jgi:hypothetical protein
MAERPILFNGPMVRAILTGQKTVTRRAVAPQPGSLFVSFGDIQNDPRFGFGFHDGETFWKSPYGQPGDRLWVRETWSTCSIFDKIKPSDMDKDYLGTIRYMADGFRSGKLRPSIFMPRWACRILLEVTAVRVERLQAMTTADSIAEGCLGGHGSIPGYIYNATPCEHFRHIWNDTGGEWKANPWVWVIDFKRVTP